MNFRQLTVFVMVAQEENMTKAAEKLYMTQPAISHMIHDLEEELNMHLFDRIGKKIYLNEIGKQFLDKTRKVLDGYEELKKGQLSAPIRIGSSITIANFWLPAFLKEMKEQAIEAIVEVDRSEVVYEKLKRNELDIALVEGNIEDDRMIQLPFSSYELHAVCGKHHPFAQQDSIAMTQLCKEPLLLREKGSAIREVFDAACNLANISMHPVYTSVNSQAIISSLKAGLGLSILPDLLVKDDKDIHQLTIEGVSLRNTNRLMILKDKYQSEAMKAFIALITKKKEPIETGSEYLPHS